jgi:S1-C subfamily serine protease
MLTRSAVLGTIAMAGLTVGIVPAGWAQEEPSQAGALAVAGLAGGPLPAGYLGITFTCKLKSEWGPAGLAITHYGYPAVASVEPESPADRAGIHPGDTILAYNDRDVRNHPILLNQLLQPHTHLAIRLRRNGEVRELTVRIARRPVDFVDMSDAPAPASGEVRPAPPTAVMPPADPVAGPQVRAVPWWTRPLIGQSFIPDDDDLAAIDGAEMVRTTPDLRQALGVSNGLLVVSVETGTPAAESSLRAGDVIISAAGVTVSTPRQLVRAIERTMTAHQDITLQVERQHKTRRLVLHW